MTLVNRGPGRGCGFTTERARRDFRRRIQRPAPPRPTAVDDTTWQAGVTPKNWLYKVHLDGQPVKNAVAARDTYGEDRGWVDVRDYADQPDGTSDPLAAKVTRLYGFIEIVPGDD